MTPIIGSYNIMRVISNYNELEQVNYYDIFTFWIASS